MEGLVEVLVSLRRKLFYIAALFILGAVGSFPFTGYIIERIKQDMLQKIAWNSPSELELVYNNLTVISQQLNTLAGDDPRLTGISSNLSLVSRQLSEIVTAHPRVSFVYLTPVEVILLRLKLSLLLGILLALPLVFYYSYTGLKARLNLNRRFLFVVSLSSITLFLLGAGYAYFFMLPLFLGYLYTDALGMGVTANYSINNFIYFVVMMVVVFGLAFELPLVVISLVRLEMVNPEFLAKYRRHTYVLLLIIAAWVTPPDIFSQILVASPFIVLYEISIVLARLLGKR